LADSELWQQSPLGRIVIGVFLTQGLALGVRMIFEAGLLTNEVPADLDVPPEVAGLLIPQTLQCLALLLAGALAGAGQRRGFVLGALVGLINNVIQMAIQLSNGEHLTPLVLYGQPLLHTTFGAVGGTLGSLIWKPLPVLNLALPLPPRKARRRVPSFPLFAGPVAWPRVAIGTIIAVGGVLSAALVLEFIKTNARGEIRIESQLQARLITWEIAGLAVLIGSSLAGANTFNGLKQGLGVGLAAGLLVAGCNHYINRAMPLEEILLIALCILGASVVGGWFGCRLFPPIVANARRGRGVIDAP
jgi:hypothetical protein